MNPLKILTLACCCSLCFAYARIAYSSGPSGILCLFAMLQCYLAIFLFWVFCMVCYWSSVIWVVVLTPIH